MILNRCYVCGIEKDVDEFNKQTRSKDGLKGDKQSEKLFQKMRGVHNGGEP